MPFDVHTTDGQPAGRLEVSRAGLMTVFEYSWERDPGPSRLALTQGELVFWVGVPLPYAGGLRLTRKFSRLALGELDPGGPFTAYLVPVGGQLPAPDVSGPAPCGDEPAPDEIGPVPCGDEPAPDVSEDAPCDDEPAPDVGEDAPRDGGPAPGVSEDAPCDSGPSPDGGERDGGYPDVWLPEKDPARHFEDPALRATAGETGGVLMRADGEDTLLAFPWAPSKPFPMLPAFRLGTAQDIDGGHYMVFRVRNGRPV